MALIGTINIAMTATTAAMGKGFKQAQGMVGSFQGAMGKLGDMASGFTGGALQLSLSHSIKLAEELRENIERLDVSFGESSASIVDGADRMAEAFGTSKIAFTGAAQKLGGMFKSAGVGEEASAGMTNQLLTLTQAMANFSHIPFEAALGKVRAALGGRGKAVAEYGIGINEAAIKNEALASGLMKVGGHLDAAGKKQAIFNIMMREGAGVIDQMGARANDRKNAFAEFQGRLENIQELFGEKMPAPVESFFAQLNVALVAATQAWTEMSNGVIGNQNDVSDWGQSSANSMGIVQKSIGWIADAWQLVSAGFHAFRASLTEGLGMILDGLGWVGKKIEWLLDKLGMNDTGDTGIQAFVDNWAEGLHDAASKEFEDLQAEWKKPWASEGINAAFDTARKSLHAARAEVIKSAKDSVAPAASAKAKELATAGAKSAGAALSVGSSEAASAMIRSRYGLNDSAKDGAKVAANSDKQVDLLKSIDDKLGTVADHSGEDPEVFDG